MSVTPILDLEQSPPLPPRRSLWLTWVLAAAVGAGIGLAGPPSGIQLPGFNFPIWFLFLYVMVAIHELAHLGIGHLVGMPPGGIVVGGFILLRSGDRWTFRFNRRMILGGGVAIPMPANGAAQSAAFAWMVAAGPAASLLCTVACWLAYRAFGNGVSDWIGSAFWAAAVGLVSAIPMSVGLHQSDGARLWQLWRRPEQAAVWTATVAVQAQNMKGVRPRDWDDLLTARMLAEPAVYGRMMGYYRYLDRNDEAAAAGWLEQALASSSTSGKVLRQCLYFEAAEVSALIRHNPQQARAWRERALQLRKPECGACTDSAIAISESRFADALADITRTRAFLDRMRQITASRVLPANASRRARRFAASPCLPPGLRRENLRSPDRRGLPFRFAEKKLPKRPQSPQRTTLQPHPDTPVFKPQPTACNPRFGYLPARHRLAGAVPDCGVRVFPHPVLRFVL